MRSRIPNVISAFALSVAAVSWAVSIDAARADKRPLSTRTGATTNALPAPLKPSDTAVPGVRNFAKISDVLYRGDQPTRQGFQNLKKLGIKTVINLRTFHSDRDDLEGTGLRYVHIYSQAWHVEDEDVARFLKVVRDPKNQPVFVHCQQGADRTGLLVAAYRIADQGLTPKEAAKELEVFGYNTIWTGIYSTLQKMDAKKINAMVEKTRMPRVDVVK